jgi:hypothetical protein
VFESKPPPPPLPRKINKTRNIEGEQKQAIEY